MIKKSKEHYCCDEMQYNFTLEGDKSIAYEPSTRLYTVTIENGHHRRILFCPWCGTKLPKYLNNEWEETVAKEIGITDSYYKHEDKIPKEFWTDEWWKKRGL